MKIDWIGSPNYDTNRKPIKYIVIHWMAGTLAGTDRIFQDDARDTSAHYGIEDEVIHQYVKEEHVAYHAGNYAINQASIGIEHSASPDRQASDQTYITSAMLIKEIADRYSIPIDSEHIVPHNQYKATQCPGSLDLVRLINMARDGVTDPNANNIKKAVQFDRHVSYYYDVGLIPTERSEDYVDDDKLLGVSIGLHEETIRQSETIKAQDVGISQLESEIDDLNADIAGLEDEVRECEEVAMELTEQNQKLEEQLQQCQSGDKKCPPWLVKLQAWFCK